MHENRIVVVGAGIGGLAAAVQLAAEGCGVTVVEKFDGPGGKMRQVQVGGASIDAGPTVFTMRKVFDDIFEKAGASIEDYLTLKPAEILARHAWEAGGELDLFADPAQTVDAIGAFAGADNARGYLSFCSEAANIYRILDRSFIRAQKPDLPTLMRRVGLLNVSDLWRINPYQSFWNAVCRYMSDPRLRQLFARYATYCGASPFSAPATLMLVAHVEREGVWLAEGGMVRIAAALESLAKQLGVVFRYGAEAAEVLAGNGRASGIRLRDGEQLNADAVILNADPSAASGGLLGPAAERATRHVPARQTIAIGPHLGFPGRGEGLSSRPAYSILSGCLLRIGVQRHIQAKETASLPSGLPLRAGSRRSRTKACRGGRTVPRHRQCAGYARCERAQSIGDR